MIVRFRLMMGLQPTLEVSRLLIITLARLEGYRQQASKLMTTLGTIDACFTVP